MNKCAAFKRTGFDLLRCYSGIAAAELQLHPESLAKERILSVLVFDLGMHSHGGPWERGKMLSDKFGIHPFLVPTILRGNSYRLYASLEP